MERKPPKPMTPFDSMVTPPYLYSLKLLLPYTPQSHAAFYGNLYKVPGIKAHYGIFPRIFLPRPFL